MNPVIGDSRPAQAYDIDAHNIVNSLLHHERGDVFGGDRTSAEQRQSADANKLMNRAVAGQNYVVSNQAMSPHYGPVGKDAIMADHAIMRDVAIGHEVIVAAD